MLGRGCPLDELPVKILGTKSPMGVPGGQHFTYRHNSLLGESVSPHWSNREDTGSWRLVSTHRRVHLFPWLISLVSSLCDNLRLRASPRPMSFHMSSYLVHLPVALAGRLNSAKEPQTLCASFLGAQGPDSEGGPASPQTD